MHTVPTQIEKPTKPVLPLPEPITTSKFDWYVLTPATIPQGDFVFFAVTPKGYEQLSLNEADTLRWVKEAKWRLDYYGRE